MRVCPVSQYLWQNINEFNLGTIPIINNHYKAMDVSI
jgi:hypothetical protein